MQKRNSNPGKNQTQREKNRIKHIEIEKKPIEERVYIIICLTLYLTIAKGEERIMKGGEEELILDS